MRARECRFSRVTPPWKRIPIGLCPYKVRDSVELEQRVTVPTLQDPLPLEGEEHRRERLSFSVRDAEYLGATYPPLDGVRHPGRVLGNLPPLDVVDGRRRE